MAQLSEVAVDSVGIDGQHMPSRVEQAKRKRGFGADPSAFEKFSSKEEVRTSPSLSTLLKLLQQPPSLIRCPRPRKAQHSFHRRARLGTLKGSVARVTSPKRMMVAIIITVLTAKDTTPCAPSSRCST